MQKYLPHFILLLLPVIISCNAPVTSVRQEEDVQQFTEKAGKLSAIAQQTLLKEVSGAIQEGGTVYAVAFCSQKAMILTDSVSKAHDLVITRITNKPRNAANGLKTAMDSAVWQRFEQAVLQKDSIPAGITETGEKGTLVYYKPIFIGMPTCLQCHGEPGKNIDALTMQALNERYPDDNAFNYTVGMLRGLWKITAVGDLSE
ncbi:MAG: DUF3365 domain-containing protein [Chitinophagaceae bacterium]|nr:DUF3365 domain-containing protein [Chitinophagaceae bacterium]